MFSSVFTSALLWNNQSALTGMFRRNPKEKMPTFTVSNAPKSQIYACLCNSKFVLTLTWPWHENSMQHFQKTQKSPGFKRRNRPPWMAVLQTALEIFPCGDSWPDRHCLKSRTGFSWWTGVCVCVCVCTWMQHNCAFTHAVKVCKIRCLWLSRHYLLIFQLVSQWAVYCTYTMFLNLFDWYLFLSELRDPHLWWTGKNWWCHTQTSS